MKKRGGKSVVGGGSLLRKEKMKRWDRKIIEEMAGMSFFEWR
jgi:hypothetical protein